jgi:hypothetical protein
MMQRLILFFLGLGCGLHLATAAESPVATTGLRPQPFSGWQDCLVLSGGDCKAVLLPAVGGRVAFFALNGDNAIYEEPGSSGKTLANAPGGFAIGGAACDLGPEGRPIPEHNLSWLGPWTWQSPRPNKVTLRSEPDPGVGVELEKEVVMDPDSGELGLVNRMKNVTNTGLAYCLWDRTLSRPGGYLLVPLNKKSRFQAGWSLARKDPAGKTVYDGERPADPRAQVIEGVLIVAATGELLKAGADSDAEWVAYTVGRLLFVKYYPCSAQGNYSQKGHSVAFTCEARRVEWGPLSPEIPLKAGETYAFPEKWVLLELPRSARSFAEARALARSLPPSPFHK